MNATELILKKREGKSLTESELRFLVQGYVDGSIPDYQISAFLMACYFRGLAKDETATLTRLMLHSGTVIDLSDIPGIKVDKHSTGGVGDKVSLILAPIVAACGVPVPMISGRGLGHTGGTLDKLESIPGFRSGLSIEEYKNVIRKTGLVMIGQTREIVPADKKMYALRDVTGTVESIPLIAASIMSKKLAEGIDALVLDVKTGRGAFMQSLEHAADLARIMIDIGAEFNKEVLAFVTDMNNPLGVAIGNWLEVVESVECLRNTRGTNDASSDLMEVTYTLAGAMIMIGKKAGTIHQGITKAREAVHDGTAYAKFLELVEVQGGDRDAITNLERYPVSRFSLEVKSAARGTLQSIDPLELGLTAISLGAGRKKVDEAIDPKAGILLKKKMGDSVLPGDVLAMLFTDREEILQEARERIRNAFRISQQPAAPPPLIVSMIDQKGQRSWPPK
ncbi:MAG: thymidine phosphorylase [Ignavibacteriales bacterium]|nr:thymidine phosphorylase [Ignavibacteriales bacterium]